MSNCTAAHSCIYQLFLSAASPLEVVQLLCHTSLFSDSRSTFNFCLSIAFSSSVTLCTSCQGHKVRHHPSFFSLFFHLSVLYTTFKHSTDKKICIPTWRRAFCTIIWLYTRAPSSGETVRSSSFFREKSCAPFKMPKLWTVLKGEQSFRF